MPDPVWTDLVRIAGRSPSTHNTQGWRLVDEGDAGVTLCFDHARTLPAEDRTGAFNMVNMGVFVRALEIAAAAAGNALSVALEIGDDGAPAEHTRVARLTLVNGAGGAAGDGSRFPTSASGAARSPAELLDLLERRRTGRFPYDGRPVPDVDLERLAAVVERGGHRFGWTHDPDRIRRLMELNADTIADDLQEAPIRRELRAWTRFTRAEAERTGDGLWAACMNQSGAQLRFTYAFPWILRFGWVRRMASRGYLQSQGGTATMAWMAGSLDDRSAQFETGRTMLDWWLELTALGIDMLPYGSLYTRPEAYRAAADEIGVPDWWIIVRLGYGPEPPRSFRLDPESLWLRTDR